jgi:outer membrane receptor protein involved in Fe transport
MRPLVKGFRHQQFRKHWLPMEINTSLKPEIGWNYELGLKLHGKQQIVHGADLL